MATNFLIFILCSESIIGLAYGEHIMRELQVGDGPESIVFNASTNKFYMINVHDDTVSVIDGNTDSVIGTIRVGDVPKAVTVNPSTNKIYVAHLNDGRILIIDGNTDRVSAEVGLKGVATGIAINPSTNKIYVSLVNDDTVSVIDGNTDSVIGTIRVGDGPRGITVNPSTNKIYVSNNFGNTISVLDGSSDMLVKDLNVGNAPFGIAINPSTNKIYVSNFIDDTVSVIDGNTDSVMGTPKVGDEPFGIAINPSTNKIYVSNRADDTISVINGLIEVFAEESIKNLDISITKKHEGKLSFISLKNNADEKIFGLRLKMQDGMIMFVKAFGWDRERINQSVVSVQTTSDPITQGKSMKIILMFDNTESFFEWSALGENSTTLSSGLLNPFVTKSTGEVVEISSRVSNSSDDAEETVSTGQMSLRSSDLELVNDGAKQQIVGIRFQDLQIPQGATVIDARIYFKVDQVDKKHTSLTFYAETTDNASKFTSTTNNISNRGKTSTFINWNDIPVWDSVRSIMSTPDLSPIIQEVINRPGWISGNSIVIIVTGSGERTAESYDGDPTGAPLLVISYVTERP